MVKFTDGLYSVFKPSGINTYDLIRIIKKNFKKEVKIGHGGSLDPIAEGVVVVGIGKEFTKKLHQILNFAKKEYIAEILLDFISDTYDVTGKLQKVNVEKIPSYEEVKKVINKFIGEIEQFPPPYSAKKFCGERICDLLREKKLSIQEAKMIIKPKKVKIYNIEILDYKFPKIVLKIECASGTYIRSLANDIGKNLSCGGVVSKIVRTKVGDFCIEEAIKIV
ncbi:MAG: tRNA pseudouridine(55) synthase TruB [Endomicrobiia bacterium]